jgi:hypothetical protein
VATTGAIELLVRHLGNQRLLFGSDAPSRPLQCALNALWFARISESQRTDIFSSNAERLIGTAVPDASPLAQMPPPTPVPLLDAHAHIGRFPYPLPDEDEMSASTATA